MAKRMRARSRRMGTIKGASHLIESSIKITNKTVRGAKRHCVRGLSTQRAPGFEGKGAKVRFYGCFISAQDAQRQANRLRSAARH